MLNIMLEAFDCCNKTDECIHYENNRIEILNKIEHETDTDNLMALFNDITLHIDYLESKLHKLNKYETIVSKYTNGIYTTKEEYYIAKDITKNLSTNNLLNHIEWLKKICIPLIKNKLPEDTSFTETFFDNDNDHIVEIDYDDINSKIIRNIQQDTEMYGTNAYKSSDDDNDIVNVIDTDNFE